MIAAIIEFFLWCFAIGTALRLAAWATEFGSWIMRATSQFLSAVILKLEYTVEYDDAT